MKVLLVQKMAGISGSERYLLSLLPELRRRGIDATCLVVQHPRNARKNEELINELRQSEVPVHTINSRLPISPSLVWKIARLVKREGIDILQTNLIHADVWGACVKRLFVPRLRILSVKHGYSESFQSTHGLDPHFVRPDVMSFLTRWSASHTDGVVCISKALESFLNLSRLVPPTKTTTIPYGFDFSNAPSAVATGEARRGHPQIVVPGRLVKVKQHHLLLQVLPRLLEEFPNLSVVMVGAGPLLEPLRTQTASLGLNGHVHWEGFRSNMHDYLRDSDLVVLPSAAEGFGLVVLEAWHHSKAVVAFDVPALNEVIDNGVDGALVPPFDTERLLHAIRSLLLAPQVLQALGGSGKNKLADKYGLAAMTARTVDVLRGLMAGHGRRTDPNVGP